jgi:hypothetical protein
MATFVDGAGKRRAARREAGCVLSTLPGTSGIDQPFPQDLPKASPVPQPAALNLPKTPTNSSDEAMKGLSWGGMGEVLHRIVLGHSPSIFQVLAKTARGPQGPVPPEHLAQTLGPVLAASLQAQIVFAPMPIQDAIDLAEFLVYSAVMYSRFTPGAQMVGGMVEIAAITKHEGFKWINRKHYYDKKLNREAIHVIHD